MDRPLLDLSDGQSFAHCTPLRPGTYRGKRARSQSDIFSTIVRAHFEADGSTLSVHELRSFFGLLFPVGAETTTCTISGGVLALIERPEAWQRLRLDPSLLKTTVEEIIRGTTPSCYKRRTATRDTELCG